MTNLEELEKLSDKELEDIYVKGENLHVNNSRASTAKRLLDSRKNRNYLVNRPIIDIPENHFPNIVNANATLSLLSDVNKNLNIIAHSYSDAFGAASTYPILELRKSLESIQKSATSPVWQEIANNTVGSAILNAVSDIQRLNIQPTFPNILENFLPQKLANDITLASKQKTDKIFNFPAYKYIYNLEVYLRNFITKYIIEPNTHQLPSKIPPDMLESWETKKKNEEGNVHIDHPEYELIEYSDFTDLKRILEKKTTVSLLKNVISEENLKTITSKLTELEPIRLKIAHSRALSEDEFNTLETYSNKIVKILK